MHGSRGEERRNEPSFNSEQLEAIATRAAEIALDKVYSDVGKGVVRRFAWAVGIGFAIFIGYLIRKGHLPP